MRPEDREELFFTLSELAEKAGEEASLLSDLTLEAFREGELSDSETADVERQLVGNPANRRRLEALAASALATPAAGLRRGVLEAVMRDRNRGKADSGLRRLSRRRWRPVLAAAAVLFCALGLGLWTLRSQPEPPPAYSVQIAGLKERRGLGEPGLGELAQMTEAYAETQVTISATVVERAVAGVEIGLYRLAGGGLERLPLSGNLVRNELQGVVVFEAPASSLVGSQPGQYEIFIVIAWKGDLPALMAPGEDPMAALAAHGRRRVHRLTLRLLAERSAGPLINSRRLDEETAHVLADPTISMVSDRFDRIHLSAQRRTSL